MNSKATSPPGSIAARADAQFERNLTLVGHELDKAAHVYTRLDQIDRDITAFLREVDPEYLEVMTPAPAPVLAKIAPAITAPRRKQLEKAVAL